MAMDNKQKRRKVKQKDYIGLVNPPHASELWGHNKDVLKHSEKRTKKGEQMKVKLEDYLSVLKMMSPEHSSDKHGNKSLLKSTKQRREIFTDGFQSKPQDPRKRAVFLESNVKEKEKEEKNIGMKSVKVKRYHSPREVSKVLEDCTSPKHQQRHGRRHLEEENPLDFGAYLHDKFSSWLPKAKASVKEKMPVVTGSSGSYDLLKGQAEADKSLSNSSGSKDLTKSDCSEKEIYISLEKKTPREKNECINKSMPKLLKGYETLTEVHDGNVSAETVTRKDNFVE